MNKPLKPMRMTDEQARTIKPDSTVWVMASAGSGKTQVLTDRVIRLLIDGTRPEAILCLTYTRAAAAEMATRIYDRLAAFVRLEDAQLKDQLAALNALTDDQTLERARSLFAHTLEAHGGLKIQTIHSFCQSLLARFPLEANLIPGFAALDDRTGALLERDAINQILSDAFESNDVKTSADLYALAMEASDDGLIKTVSELAAKLEKSLSDSAASTESMEPRLRDALRLPLAGDAQSYLASIRTSGKLDMVLVQHVADVWKKSTSSRRHENAGRIERWLKAVDAGESFNDFLSAFVTQKNEPVSQSRAEEGKSHGIYNDVCSVAGQLQSIQSTLILLNWVPVAAAANRLAFRLIAILRAHKQNAGLISFSDLISKTAKLLENPMAQWILYKLDDTIQHILLDEAQDTSAEQWRILDGLSSEFYAGQSASETRRTFFAVGDDKQAIFGFQGSEPDIFQQRGTVYHQRSNAAGVPFDAVSLSRSFRSTAAVLAFVDANIEYIKTNNLGGRIETPRHIAHRAQVPGEVVLWPSITVAKGDAAEALDDDPTPWRPPAERVLAQNIAAQIKAWTEGDEPISVESQFGARRVRPGDILILVRRRSELMAALVSELKAAGVPVAGVDRMMLTKQLVVMDILACVRFVLQPNDDLMLATLLRSPFLGWDEDALFGLAYPRGKGQSLWSALRDACVPKAAASVNQAAAWVNQLLNAAERTPPYEFLMTILEVMGGRAALLKRLGLEADDPITMLLDAALEYELEHTPSLQGFLYWLDSSEQQIKRDPEAPLDQVRLMTVHGAKGLQAPVVIVADCCGALQDHGKVVMLQAGSQAEQLPAWYARQENLSGALDEAKQGARTTERAEYWRLWYVALTRAADRLYITGWNSNRPESKDETTWYDVAEATFATLADSKIIQSRLWGETQHFAIGVFPEAASALQPSLQKQPVTPLPVWAMTLPVAEAVPPRPLYPSQLVDEATLVWDSPAGAFQRQAVERGNVLHKLLEILPGLPTSERHVAAQKIVQSTDFADAEALIASVMAVMADPAFADVFQTDALVEVPISALLDNDQVLSGRIDRLVITKSRVLCVDYKTSLKVPERLQDVPVAHLRQLAAYKNALSRIYTGLDIQTAILWTSQPKLMLLPAEILSPLMQ